MKIVNQSYEILSISHADPMLFLEKCARTCYKSEEKITEGSSEKLIKSLIKNGHHSQLEHVSVTVKFITNRGVTHELVRHRLAVYSQESTRYVNYKNQEMQFIRPVWFERGCHLERIKQDEWIWLRSMGKLEQEYKNLIQEGWSPQQAREVLPNSLKTEIVMTCNIREWIHVFNLRCSIKAHPQMRALMLDCLGGFYKEMPILFEDMFHKYIDTEVE